MATKIEAQGDTIKISKTFVSGKDRITVNGELVFEGKLSPGKATQVSLGEREYSVETRVTSMLMNALSVQLEIHEQGNLIHSGTFDQFGKPVASQAEAKATAAQTVCIYVGCLVGVAVITVLNMSTDVVPGGVIGGAIGGLLGGSLGAGVGKLLFGGRK